MIEMNELAVGRTYRIDGVEVTIVHMEPEQGEYTQLVVREEHGRLRVWWRSDFLHSAHRVGPHGKAADGIATYVGRYDSTNAAGSTITFDVYADWPRITRDLAVKLRSSRTGRATRMHNAIRAVIRKEA